MKSRLLLVAASSALLFVPRTAGAVETATTPSIESGRTQMLQDANESEQATTDMSYGAAAGEPGTGSQAVQGVSYGGAAAGRSETGSRVGRCGAGPECRIYFGH